MTSLVERIIAVHEALDAAHIDHAFGGALALAFATEEPRGTRDIDCNVFVGSEQAEVVFRSLPGGVHWGSDELRRARREDQVRLHWGLVPLDLFFSTHAFHDRARARAMVVPFAGTTIPVLHPTDLCVFKVLFDRPRDWVDIAAMHGAGSIDAADAVAWSSVIIGDDDPRIERLREALDAA